MIRKPISICLWMMLATAGVVLAQEDPPVFERTEEIAFDRPEAWAMQRAASLLLLTSLAPPTDRDAGSVDLSLELIWNPNLSEEERRVGFNGTKVEDLNRLEVIPRPRVTVGLGWRTSLEVTYIPPIELRGIKPNILSAALERPVADFGNWVLGVRAYGQVGKVEGDITCPKDEAAIPPGDPGNEFGCEEPSRDEVDLNYAGFGLTGGYRLPNTRGSAFHFGAFANYMDLAFQVDALTFGVRDRSKLVTDGWTWSITGGFSWPLSERLRLAFEAFYTPLEVVRPPSEQSQNDALFNFRSMLSYSF